MKLTLEILAAGTLLYAVWWVTIRVIREIVEAEGAKMREDAMNRVRGGLERGHE